MSKYNNPIQKYIIDAILIIVFVVLWGVISNLENLDTTWRMLLAVIEYTLYDRALKFNKEYHT